jgi:uncharacterized membrane protein
MSGTSMPAPAQDRGAGNDAAARLETLIGRLMVWGVYAAMALILVGIVLAFLAGYDLLAQGLKDAPAPAAVVDAVLTLQPEGFLWAGIVLLIAIPIGRVVVSGVGFLATGERRFALISLLVLLVVLASITAALNLEG